MKYPLYFFFSLSLIRVIIIITMKIKNSRLELQRVDNLSDVPSVMKREDLRYKTIYAIFPKSIFKNYPCVSISFKDKN